MGTNPYSVKVTCITWPNHSCLVQPGNRVSYADSAWVVFDRDEHPYPEIVAPHEILAGPFETSREATTRATEISDQRKKALVKMPRTRKLATYNLGATLIEWNGMEAVVGGNAKGIGGITLPNRAWIAFDGDDWPMSTHPIPSWGALGQKAFFTSEGALRYAAEVAKERLDEQLAKIV